MFLDTTRNKCKLCRNVKLIISDQEAVEHTYDSEDEVDIQTNNNEVSPLSEDEDWGEESWYSQR